MCLFGKQSFQYSGQSHFPSLVKWRSKECKLYMYVNVYSIPKSSFHKRIRSTVGFSSLYKYSPSQSIYWITEAPPFSPLCPTEPITMNIIPVTPVCRSTHTPSPPQRTSNDIRPMAWAALKGRAAAAAAVLLLLLGDLLFRR